MSDTHWLKIMKSIKKRLLTGLLVVIVLSTLIGTAITFFELKEEMDELFDQNMKQIAHAIAVHNITEQSDFVSGHDDIRRTLKGEEEFLIQVWHNDDINFSSKPAIAFPNQGAGGVVTVLYENEEWRYYAINSGDGWLVQVSQPIPLRHTVIWEIYSEQLIPTLIQLPILMGLVWLVVGVGFAPLKRISESIEKRTAYFLERLPEDDVPKEVYSMVQAINGLLDRLSQALDSQRRFTADAAHELRTPLTAVRLELDILKKAENQEERGQSLEKLYGAVDRSTRLVHQLLEMARSEPEQASEEIKTVALKPLVQKLIDELMPLADKKSITLQMKDFENVSIEGRSHALSIMAGNLINNAVQYTPERGRIEISAKSDKGRIIVKVSDDGPGIPENERDRVFDRFYRILDPAHSGITGSGLGLSIVESIADAHRATIAISEGLGGKGVSFEIHFPSNLVS